MNYTAVKRMLIKPSIPQVYLCWTLASGKWLHVSSTRCDHCRPCHQTTLL